SGTPPAMPPTPLTPNNPMTPMANMITPQAIAAMRGGGGMPPGGNVAPPPAPAEMPQNNMAQMIQMMQMMNAAKAGQSGAAPDPTQTAVDRANNVPPSTGQSGIMSFLSSLLPGSSAGTAAAANQGLGAIY